MKHNLYPVPSKKELILGSLYLAFQWLFLPVIVVLVFQDSLSVTRMNCMLFAVNFAVTLPIFRRFLRASMEEFLQHPGFSLFCVLKGFGIYWLGNYVLSFVILGIDPNFANINDATIDAMAAEDFGLMALCTVVLVPIVEELLYRGIFFGGLYNRNRIVAFVVSTLIFALIHVTAYVGYYPPMTLLLCFLQYIPAGIALAWAWMKSGTILTPIVMHMIINAIGITAMR
jgi:membrane protease YdiL (CAAX protease family)